MKLFSFGKKSKKTFTCEKCNKIKKESDGNFLLEEKAFCCKECCGDPSQGEHKEQADGICEFC